MERDGGDGDGARRRSRYSTAIHITALDGVVNVNSLFTFAVFLGLTFNPGDTSTSLVDNPAACAASPAMAENLVSFHVYSFASFLFSSLVALCIKQAIRTHTFTNSHPIVLFDRVDVNKTALLTGTLISALGSVSGCTFLILALLNLVQLKLGTLSCGSSSYYSYFAVVPLLLLGSSGLLVYISFVLYAFFH